MSRSGRRSFMTLHTHVTTDCGEVHMRHVHLRAIGLSLTFPTGPAHSSGGRTGAAYPVLTPIPSIRTQPASLLALARVLALLPSSVRSISSPITIQMECTTPHAEPRNGGMASDAPLLGVTVAPLHARIILHRTVLDTSLCIESFIFTHLSLKCGLSLLLHFFLVPAITLGGRESKLVFADYSIRSPKARYITAQVFYADARNTPRTHRNPKPAHQTKSPVITFTASDSQTIVTFQVGVKELQTVRDSNT
ncbi:Glycoside hydrolase family 35 protein [Mycena venus]|uniref:Glycoside hydrolase family 35 protein n=1 Tax=Mycena venus TaxID=2733690 RepID=A0A8H6Z2C2_9AGAR|nr:Glycoside hydrolase family 35 protein [Mycena venus]